MHTQGPWGPHKIQILTSKNWYTNLSVAKSSLPSQTHEPKALIPHPQISYLSPSSSCATTITISSRLQAVVGFKPRSLMYHKIQLLWTSTHSLMHHRIQLLWNSIHSLMHHNYKPISTTTTIGGIIKQTHRHIMQHIRNVIAFAALT